MGVQHDMRDAPAQRRQRVLRRRHHHVACQQQIRLAAADAQPVQLRLLRRQPDMAEHAAALLRHAHLVKHRHVPPVEMRGHAKQRADGDDAGAADAGDEDVVGMVKRGDDRFLHGEKLGRIARTLAQLAAMHSHKTRAEPLDAGKILVAARLVDAPLGAEIGLHRLHGQAVRRLRAVATGLADGGVDEGALVRIGEGAALAPAALLGGAGLVVDDDRGAQDVAEFALDLLQVAAMAHRHAGGEILLVVVLLRLVGDDDDAVHPLGRHLSRDLRHGEVPVDRLAAGHRHRVVEQYLVGNVYARSDGGADGHVAGMEIGAVAEIGKNMLLLGKRRLTDPLHALAAHLAERFRVAVHPQRQRMAADATERTAAVDHLGRGVVRAARAEIRLPDRADMHLFEVARLFAQEARAGLQLLAVGEGGDPAGQCEGKFGR